MDSIVEVRCFSVNVNIVRAYRLPTTSPDVPVFEVFFAKMPGSQLLVCITLFFFALSDYFYIFAIMPGSQLVVCITLGCLRIILQPTLTVSTSASQSSPFTMHCHHGPTKQKDSGVRSCFFSLFWCPSKAVSWRIILNFSCWLPISSFLRNAVNVVLKIFKCLFLISIIEKVCLSWWSVAHFRTVEAVLFAFLLKDIVLPVTLKKKKITFSVEQQNRSCICVSSILQKCNHSKLHSRI